MRNWRLWTSLATLLLMGMSLPSILAGSRYAVREMFNAPRLWVPEDFDARVKFMRFVEQFEAQEMILISWPGCTVDDERLRRLEEALDASRRDPGARGSDAPPGGEEPLFSHVVSGYTLVRKLTSEPLELSRSDAVERLEGILVGPDGRTSCAAVFLTPHGAIEREEALERILLAADETVGLDRDDYRLAGPAIDGIAIDRESSRSIKRFGLPSAILSFLLCWVCLRSLWLTFPVVVTAIFGQTLMLASVHYSAFEMNAILIVLPPLVFVLTVSAGVHLANYYLEALRTGEREGATSRALANGWLPCLLAAGTTAIGVGSLVVSDVGPVRQFGVLAALGIMITFGLLLLLLPGATESWPAVLQSLGRVPLLRRFRASLASRLGTASENRADRIWGLLSALVARRHRVISFGCVALLLFLAVGLMWVRTSVNAVALLGPENRNTADVRWFEENIGPLVPVEIIVRLPHDGPLDVLQRLDLVRQVERELGRMDLVGGTMSAATFTPSTPEGGGARHTVHRAILRNRIASRLGALADAHYLHQSSDQQSWRVSGRVVGQRDVNYGEFLRRVRDRVEPIINGHESPDGASGIEVTYTGVTPVVSEVQQALLDDLFRSYATALLLVSIVMILAQRSVRAGLVAMAPNVLPATVLFGVMGWTDTAVDIGSVMTASVALGIAVDGTLHFLNWFRREREAGASPQDAVAHAYRHCGRALFQTTVICAIGLLIYTMSGFVPARRFSWMMLLLLGAALVGDLIFLPAILMGRLGRLFYRGADEPAAEEADLDSIPAPTPAAARLGSAE